MKRTQFVTLGVLVLVALALGAVIWISGRGMPDNARAQLTQYAAYRYPLSPLVILNQKPATRPWFFKPEASGASYSDTVFYRTTVRYGRGVTPAGFLSTPGATPGYASAYLGQHALPYPPEELWCVRLDLGEEGSSILVVALHQDLYGADWIVHELPGMWSGADIAAALANWGCAW